MSLNRVFLIGNLGADPELRYTPSQQPVCTLRVATTDRKKNQSGEWVEQTEWHSVVAWGKTAENCSQYLQKGRKIFVEGKLQTRKWQDQEGKDRYKTEIVAQTVQFLSGAKGEGSGMAIEKSFDDSPAPFMAAQAGSAAPVSFDDDDIPF